MKRLILPLPPSLNQAYRNVRVDKRIKTDEAHQFKHDAYFLACDWRNKNGWVVPIAGHKIAMRVWYFWPDKRRRDMDNPLKLLQDALTGVVWVDDQWVLPQVMDFTVDKQNPRVEIELEVMEATTIET